MSIQPSQFFVIEREKLQSGDVIYVATDPALPGCVAEGTSADLAAAAFLEARAEYMEGLEGMPALPSAPLPLRPPVIVIDLQGSVNTRLMAETYSARS